RISQWFWLVIFMWLFIQTDYHGFDELPYAVNIIFRINPLIGSAAVLASRAFIVVLLPGLFFLLSSLVFGRWFCGWMCPLGTLLDFVHPITRNSRSSGNQQSSPGNPKRKIRYVLLIVILVAAFFGLPLVGLFDPFSILVRGLTLAGYPAFNHGVESFFTLTYQHAPSYVNAVTEPIYFTLKATILPFQQNVFKFSLLSGLILFSVFLLEKWEQRGFCRNICPLGAFYGITSRIGLLHGHGGDDSCGSCRLCQSGCRMGTIDSDRKISMSDCNLCMDCVNNCPKQIISFNWSNRSKAIQPAEGGLSRRTFLSAVATGAILPAVHSVEGGKKLDDPWILRPPGACKEDEFLARCIRCGECIKVCIGNALHPALFETGLGGMFSPLLIPRLGYCEHNCTLCGQVCPTGAIQHLPLLEKQKWVIGTAIFDKDRCLPYRGVNCMVCEEHCPISDKAIRFNEEEITDSAGRVKNLKIPYVVAGMCIGCGICENVCPLPGSAAIHVSFVGETRNPMHSDPAQ
ncbi:4Fe-4S dicluster domain-containing protein, partial [bacterium]|nr:4Fe-4S dicluster domain-containing protein [bacterium]